MQESASTTGTILPSSKQLKLVIVQLFNRDAVGETENCSDGKKSKVSATVIMSIDNLNYNVNIAELYKI